MTEYSSSRTPLLVDRNDHPFVFHNVIKHRIEFVHGSTINIIRLMAGTPVKKVSPSLPVGGPGKPLHVSRGHIFCSLWEDRSHNKVVIMVKRDKRQYYITFPYSHWETTEEKVY